MTVNSSELHARARALVKTGNTKEAAARKLSAEFAASAYVSKGKLWASFIGDGGKPTTQALA
jgi:hypothetical protein